MGNKEPLSRDTLALKRRQHCYLQSHPSPEFLFLKQVQQHFKMQFSGVGVRNNSPSWNTFFCRVLVLYNGQEEMWPTGTQTAAVRLVRPQG